ncbi:MAG: sugar phosphate nucleotidyltransferase, partial [Eubacteriales bacterium]|nr:sugar phosphate nucleotidyltransferase [Eubacteriales bacterium]
VGIIPPERILVLTNERFVPLVREQLSEIPNGNVIGEPMRRDTAGAVALAAMLCRKRFGNPVMVVLPADHVIGPIEEFQRVLLSAIERASGDEAIYTFGIKPDYPATGYGYLELGEHLAQERGVGHFQLRSFKEKPDAETAQGYCDKGTYLWNSGMFVWSTDTILQEIEKYLPEHVRVLRPVMELDGGVEWPNQLHRAFSLLPKISIDYGVMEKAADVRAIVATFSWSDVGGWPALEPFLDQDDDGNACRGQVKAMDAGHNIVFCEDPDETIALIGVDDLVVVRSGKKTLIVSRSRAEDLKKLAESSLSDCELEQQSRQGSVQTSGTNESVRQVTCCKAYDIRGRIPDELNSALAMAIGQSYAALID